MFVVRLLADAVEDIEEVCGEFSNAQKHAAHEILIRTCAKISDSSGGTQTLEEIYKTLERGRLLLLAEWTQKFLESEEDDDGESWRHPQPDEGEAPSPAG